MSENEFTDNYICENSDEVLINKFIKQAIMGFSSKDELIEKRKLVINKIEVLDNKSAKFKQRLDEFEKVLAKTCSKREETNSEQVAVYNRYLDQYRKIIKERNQWETHRLKIEELLEGYSNFNKKICFSNIRLLLKDNQNVKIGQIERKAGVGLGYMSRLEKDENTSDPSIQFIVTAAKLLNVSVDRLIDSNFSELTPTEQYLLKFFDKLKEDTINDKISWKIETPNELNNLESDFNGNVDHPLFNYETFFEQTDAKNKKELTQIVFNSKSFGQYTNISGDCFNIRLKNGIKLYLMDIENSSHNQKNEPKAKEAWMYVPQGGSSFLISTKENTELSTALKSLFSVVKESMKHPKVNNEIINAIDAYMKDDINDDFEEVPF